MTSEAPKQLTAGTHACVDCIHYYSPLKVRGPRKRLCLAKTQFDPVEGKEVPVPQDAVERRAAMMEAEETECPDFVLKGPSKAQQALSGVSALFRRTKKEAPVE